MGIGYDLADAIVREHTFMPITGDVLQIGRQTVYLTPKDAVDIMRRHNVQPPMDIGAIATTSRTRNRLQVPDGRDLISDRGFFNLLGIDNLKALDHSDYEGAEVIHNLNKPLPKSLYEIADFVVDGSTLDNVFDPALTIQNLASLLRPGGRLFAINAWSQHPSAYVLASPAWFLDYFVANKFVDCKVYVVAFVPEGANAYYLNPQCLMERGKPPLINLNLPLEMVTVVFAQKGEHSTTDVVPTQKEYRSQEDWAIYRHNLASFALIPRPHLVRSRDPLKMREDPESGYLYVNSRYQASEPNAELAHIDDLRQALNRERTSPTIGSSIRRAVNRGFQMLGYEIRRR